MRTNNASNSPLIGSFKAIENISAGDAVYIYPSDVLEQPDGYANDTAARAVWVNSDATLMSGMSFINTNYTQQKSLDMWATAGQSTNDYADKTITSKNLTGYTIHMISQGSATSGDFEFLLSSGANAITSNVKKSLTYTTANVWKYESFTVASMTADNGTYDPSATLHLGFRCVDDTGSPTMAIARIWATKTGVSYYGIKKTDVGLYSDTGSYSAAVVGVAPNAITSGNFGQVILCGHIASGYTNLIPGYMYYLDNINNVNTLAGGLTPFIEGHDTGGPAANPLYNHYSNYITVGMAVSETEMLIKADYDYIS